MTSAERDIRRKLRILNHAKEINNISKTCRYFGICREIFYRWKRAYERNGEEGLINRKPGPSYRNSPHRLSDEIVEKILYLLKNLPHGSGKDRLVFGSLS